MTDVQETSERPGDVILLTIKFFGSAVGIRVGRSKGNPLSAQVANEVSLDSHEASTDAFIIKVWLEETAEEAGRAKWRGHITHVPSGKRRYIQDLDSIGIFIMPYLERMGVKFGIGWWIRRWLLNRWKLYSRAED